MITTEVFLNRVEMTVLGQLTLADYKSFEELSNYRIRFSGPINLLLDMRQMTNLTIDAAIEEIRYVKEHPHDFGRVAVLSDSQWVTWGALLSQFFVEADITIFDDEASARNWLEQAPLGEGEQAQ